jgi:hypothetical protein
MSKIIAVAAVVLSLIAVPAYGATASTSDDPIITAPVASGSVKSGWIGPVTIDFTNAPSGAFDATLSCNDYAVLRDHTFHNQSGTSDDVQNWQLGAPITGPQVLQDKRDELRRQPRDESVHSRPASAET